MRLEPLVQLIANAGLATPQVNLFLHAAPAEIRSAVVLLPGLAGSQINWQMPSWRKDAPFQMLVRDPAAATAEALAKQVMDVLTITEQILLASTGPGVPALLITYCRPMHDPIVYPRQLSGGWEVSTNFRMAYAIQPGS